MAALGTLRQSAGLAPPLGITRPLRREQLDRPARGKSIWPMNRLSGAGARLTRIVAVGLVCLFVDGCADTPTRPRDTTLPTGRLTGDGACLSVAADGCDLVAGCGHGQFPSPVVRADGTFEVNGTYRIEVGPISINPAPPA